MRKTEKRDLLNQCAALHFIVLKMYLLNNNNTKTYIKQTNKSDNT